MPGWERPLDLLNRRHEVIAVRLSDPREIELPDVGPLIMEDAETGEQLYVDTHDRGFRRRFEAAAPDARGRHRRRVHARRGGRPVAVDRRRPRPGDRPDGDPAPAAPEVARVTFIWPPALLAPRPRPARRPGLRASIDAASGATVAAFGRLGGPPAAIARRPWPDGSGGRLPAALLLVGLTVLVVALARPQGAVDLPREEGTVILAFDVSGSMAATDLQPTRMEAAKAAAKAFVQRQPSSVVIGVVAFSDSGIAVQPPTNDQAAVLAAIDRLTPQKGTSLGQGILASLNAIAIEAAGADGQLLQQPLARPDAHAHARSRRAPTRRPSSSC